MHFSPDYANHLIFSWGDDTPDRLPQNVPDKVVCFQLIAAISNIENLNVRKWT